MTAKRLVASAMRVWSGKISHRLTNRRNRNTSAKVWLLTAALGTSNAAYRLGHVMAVGHMTLAQLLLMVVGITLAGVGFSRAWFTLHEGSHILVKNCTFTGGGLVLNTSQVD